MSDPAVRRLEFVDLGRMTYRAAAERQRRERNRLFEARGAGRLVPMRVLFVEHDPPVITISRRAAAGPHVIAPPERLAELGIEIEPTDRGGDVTWHGPGQIVAYPILDLDRVGLGVHDYLRRLESIVIAALADFDVPARRDPEATGVWVPVDAAGRAARDDAAEAIALAKVCAMGIRVSKRVTMHGLALNVAPDLAHFDTIIPCGLAGRPVTSLARLLEPGAAPIMAEVRHALRREFAASLSS